MRLLCDVVREAMAVELAFQRLEQRQLRDHQAAVRVPEERAGRQVHSQEDEGRGGRQGLHPLLGLDRVRFASLQLLAQFQVFDAAHQLLGHGKHFNAALERLVDNGIILLSLHHNQNIKSY